jgi:predicted ArsR family transcriptional regulator
MMTPISLFKRARSLDPVTSHAAADQATFANQHFDKIVECLQRFGARGKDGIAELTGLDGNQVARRLPELAKLGIVELTGKTTKSKSGRAEREWRFVPIQRELI